MEKLSPFQVFNEFKSNQLDLSSAINILATLIENSDSIIIRGESLKSLGKILSEYELSKRNKILRVIENCATSDESPQVRNIAISLIFKYFSKKSEDLFRHIICNESSVLVLRKLINLFTATDKDIKTSLRNKLEYRLCNTISTRFEEAAFFLDLFILNPHLLNDDNIPKIFFKEGIVYSDYNFWQPNEFSWYVVRKGKIRLLNFHSWKLRRIPKSIKNLSCLNYLDLTNNKLRFFPKSILPLTKLKKVKLDSNKIRKFSEHAYKFAKQNLAQKYINEGVVPEEAPVLGLFEMLTGYKLENEKALRPDHSNGHESAKYFGLNSAGHVIKLVIVPYEDFYFTFIPHQISHLVYLEELEMVFNTIRYIPNSLGDLKNLKKLDLKRNNIKELPESIGNLSSLEYLSLDWNDIRTIPETIVKLKSLKVVSISVKEISPKIRAFFDSNKHFYLHSNK